MPISIAVAHFRAREAKDADGGARVVLFQNLQDGSWFVGSEADPNLHPIPLGAFVSRDAARKYADSRFTGGAWHPVDRSSR